MNDEFKTYLPTLIPQLLNVLHSDRTVERLPTQKVLTALEVFGTALDDYLHLVIPAVVRLLEQLDISRAARRRAIETLGRLCRKLHIADYASRIIHPLSRVLDDPALAAFHEPVMDTLCELVLQLGSDYAIFIAMIDKVLKRQRITHARYDALVAKVLRLQPLAPDGAPHTGGGSGSSAVGLGLRLGLRGGMTLGTAALLRDAQGGAVLESDGASGDGNDSGAHAGNDSGAGGAAGDAAAGGAGAGGAGAAGADADAANDAAGPAAAAASSNDAPVEVGLKKLRVNEENLKKAWEASQRSTKEDWYEWTRRLSIELLRESPSPALRSCLALAQDYHPLVRELFNAAFVSCWSCLQEQVCFYYC